MSILRFFSRSLPERWTYTPGDTIWKVLPTAKGILVGENRSEKDKVVTFFGIDLRSGTVLWSGLRLEEAWWVGIEMVRNDAVFLHAFARPDMPEHAGIHVLDLRTGAMRWARRDMTLRFVSGGRVFASPVRPDGDSIILLDAATGATVGTMVDDGEDFRTERSRSESESVPSYLLPDPLTEDDPRRRMFERVARKGTIAGDVDVLSVDGASIFSYHVRRDEGKDNVRLQHTIAVVDERSRVVYNAVTHSAARMPVVDAFFVQDGTLCYVREESTLVAVSLKDAPRSR